jgi:CHAD domain-containing protein
MSLDAAKVQKPLSNLKKLLTQFPKRPSPEHVHDLRTRTRRVESMFSALMLESRNNEKRLLRDLAPVRRRAGKVRDMDVLTRFAAGLRLDGEEEGECYVELLEYLGARRYRYCQRLRSVVRQHEVSIKACLKRSARFIERGLEQGNRKQSNPANEWPVDAMAVTLRLSAELARWPTLNANNLHPFRLKTKQLLYILQLAEHVDEELITRLDGVKDAIGEWHDWQELQGIARKVVNHAQCGLLKQIRTTVHARFDHALKQANELRTLYLQVTTDRQRARPIKGASPRGNASIALAATALAA